MMSCYGTLNYDIHIPFTFGYRQPRGIYELKKVETQRPALLELFMSSSHYTEWILCDLVSRAFPIQLIFLNNQR